MQKYILVTMLLSDGSEPCVFYDLKEVPNIKDAISKALAEVEDSSRWVYVLSVRASYKDMLSHEGAAR